MMAREDTMPLADRLVVGIAQIAPVWLDRERQCTLRFVEE